MLTRQNFYILIVILCAVILAITVIRPTVPPIPEDKCVKQFVMQSVLPDGRKIDVKVITKVCLLNKHMFRIGEEITKSISEVPVMRKLETVPNFLADNFSNETFMLIKQVWVRNAQSTKGK